MSRRNKKFKIYEKLEIIDLAEKGKSIAKHKTEDGKELTIFVDKAVPGDIVDVQIRKQRRNYKEGYPVKFHKYSEKRIEPKCLHFGTCGGCTRQNLSYEEQLKYKENHTLQTLKRIGKTDISNSLPILASPEIFAYRNKLEFTFSNKRWLTQDEIDSEEILKAGNALGFHIPGMFDKILDIKECLLQAEPSNRIRLFVKNFAEEQKYEFFDLRNQTGFLRNLTIRTSLTGEVMAIFSFFENKENEILTLLNKVAEEFPEITSLMYVINPKKNDTITDLNIKLFKGKPYITEQMGDLKFKVGPKSFYQTNSKQAHILYETIKSFCNLSGNETVYDLYTGTGTIANYLASNAEKVIGVEFVEEAIEYAKENSKINNINNTVFYAGDIKDIIKEDFIQKNGKPDVIVLDPPRPGIHKDALEVLKKSGAKKIVYVSCNPATQARDIEIIADKYKTVIIQPVDMFPHTHHSENIVLLELKS